MFRVTGPELVIAACRAGVAAAFPVANARTPTELDSWLDRMAAAANDGAPRPAPHCANLVMDDPNRLDHLACLVNNPVEIAITVGSPAPVVETLHSVGTLVFADVATIHHARRALQAGADGLILLSAGAGGKTGWLSPFAFVRAVREFYDGPVVLSGGLSDGTALRAALELGADLGYMGTKFIAAEESLASVGYRKHLVDSNADGVLLTRAFTGLPANFLRSSVEAAGLDPDNLDEEVTPEIADAVYGAGRAGSGPKRWSDVVSAGHSVTGVKAVEPTAAIVAQIESEFHSVLAAH
ncbi:NAD(P)H-dependent flavin oxidoreductase [Mycolicibacterium sp.]|uniref:NAD(P)H-dependent flavin oxidoreductase n=1 Tax=Mycolicibacterium sp. TaxID=2320850 RepID=UPI003D11F49D